MKTQFLNVILGIAAVAFCGLLFGGCKESGGTPAGSGDGGGGTTGTGFSILCAALGAPCPGVQLTSCTAN